MANTSSTDLRRWVPRTDAILADPRLEAAAVTLGVGVVKSIVADAQDRARRGEIAPAEVADTAVRTLPARPASMRPVLNATGVVVHTNLGRATLSAAAIEAMVAAAGPTDVELDLHTGRRGRRGEGATEALRAAVPLADGAHIVNNGAAAIMLAATALASGREIVVSRGELVEIGDGFRLTDLLMAAGARLREVGTTNRTTVTDYAAAIGPDSAFILKVHPSNFVVSGFTASASVADLAALDVPVVVDIGSGLLAADPLLPDEPDATSSLRAGAALVTASGDKLLGGPQAGLLLGRVDLIERLRRHPMARAVRVDKLTLAALEATLRGPMTPTRRALHSDPDALYERTATLRDDLAAAGIKAEVVASVAVVGGGGAPGVELPSWALAIDEEFTAPLRLGDPPIIGRVERGSLLLDLRCVPDLLDAVVRDAVIAARPW